MNHSQSVTGATRTYEVTPEQLAAALDEGSRRSHYDGFPQDLPIAEYAEWLLEHAVNPD